MPVGYGGMDIYYSERKGGFLSQAINLGPHINTPGNEVFPFIAEDGRLFFASNGHPGLGGMDLFLTLPVQSGFSEPINLGPGLNSSFDDFSFCLTGSGQSGFFASNRNEGNGSDDIYSFEFIRPLLFTEIIGTTINKTTGLGEADVTINVIKGDGTPVASFQSDDNGNFNIHLLRDQVYRFSFRKRLMEAHERDISPSLLKDYSKLNLKIELVPR
jgi:hypothetical protein